MDRGASGETPWLWNSNDGLAWLGTWIGEPTSNEETLFKPPMKITTVPPVFAFCSDFQRFKTKLRTSVLVG